MEVKIKMFDNILNFIDNTLLNGFTQGDGSNFSKVKYTVELFGALSNVLGNIFDYENMENIDEIDLKRTFFYSNYVGFDEDLEKFIPLVPAGSKNIYNEYTEFNSAIGDVKKRFSVFDKYTPIGYSRSFFTVSDAFLCYDYACRLAEVLISIDNSIIASRILNVFVGSENQELELKQIYEKLNCGIPSHITAEFNEENFKAVQLKEPQSVVYYYDCFRNILNEFLTVSGLSSLVNPSKKERLITGETENNEDIKSTILFDKYQNRVKFFEKINEAFGHDYKVKFNVNLSDDFGGFVNPLNKEKGGEDNGESV